MQYRPMSVWGALTVDADARERGSLWGKNDSGADPKHGGKLEGDEAFASYGAEASIHRASFLAKSFPKNRHAGCSA